MNPKKKSRRCWASVSIQALDLAISRFIHSLAPNSPAGEGMGSPNSNDWRKSLALADTVRQRILVEGLQNSLLAVANLCAWRRMGRHGLNTRRYANLFSLWSKEKQDNQLFYEAISTNRTSWKQMLRGIRIQQEFKITVFRSFGFTNTTEYNFHDDFVMLKTRDDWWRQ